MFFLISSKKHLYILWGKINLKRKKKVLKNSNVNAIAIFPSIIILEVFLIINFAYHSFTNIWQNASKGTKVKDGAGVL